MKFKANEGITGISIEGHFFEADENGIIEIDDKIYASRDASAHLPISIFVAENEKNETSAPVVEVAKKLGRK